MNEIELKITVEEANLMLEALGQLPFARVYALVAKLQQQASAQINGGRPSGAPAAPKEVPDGQ